MTSTFARLVALSSGMLLAGCASITGLDGTSSYSCKAPAGVKCDSVSGTYHNALQNNLPSQRRSEARPEGTAPSRPADPVRAAPTGNATAAASGAAGEGATSAAAPLRAAPRILRLWVKAWEDADRDLVGESVVYVQVDNGRWLVDHAQRQSREPYAPVRPTKAHASPARPAEGDNSAAQVPAEEGTGVTQALRALQGRPSAAPTGN